MQAAVSKYKPRVIFCIITLLYSATYFFVFKGFNGTDDLHYAMLAARMVNGNYNPFSSGDIFSGRILLIAWQALLYYVGGVHVFTTQLSTLLAVVFACYLTVFSLLRASTAATACIASAMFYFNPVLFNAAKGIFPDIYVIICGVITLIFWNKSLQQIPVFKNILYGAGIGLALVAGIFFKETILVFFVLLVCLAFIYRSRQAAITSLAMLGTLAVCGALVAVWYYHYTGNVLFRLAQVKNSSYLNPCSYDALPSSYLVARLTYEPWKGFIIFGFYPVVLAAALIIYNLFLYKPLEIFKNSFVLCFFILLATGLYFPFSLNGYQPLCGDVRHFLFLLPLAVCAVAPYITANIETAKTAKWFFAAGITCPVCVAATGDKWQWMIWGLMAVYFLLTKLVAAKISIAFKTVAFAAVLWLCMPYQLFYNNSNWFSNITQLNRQLTGSYYYFPDHDNMMHWQLLHGFNSNIHMYDLDSSPFKIFRLYYEKMDTSVFHPGWLLVNTKYIARSPAYLHSIDSLQKSGYFTQQQTVGNVRALYLATPSRLSYIQQLTANDVKVVR
ncbi:MAG TPA: hypothetical protein VHB48_12445 [Chitinophagaceae bacterium]|nr:hypothetical protein [Chitinophagaceae bacterium]